MRARLYAACSAFVVRMAISRHYRALWGPASVVLVRDELLLRLEHYRRQLAVIDAHLEKLRAQVPQVEALLDIHGVGLYTALLVIGELGENSSACKP